MCKRNVISLLRDVIFISLQVVAVCKKRVYIVDRIRVFFFFKVLCIVYRTKLPQATTIRSAGMFIPCLLRNITLQSKMSSNRLHSEKMTDRE